MKAEAKQTIRAKKLGELLQRKREECGLKADDLGAMLNVGKHSIYKYEYGQLKKVDLKFLRRMAKILKIDYSEISEILGYCEPEEINPEEVMEESRGGEPMLIHSVENCIEGILREIEEETFEREGLKGTPKRVAKAYSHIFSGYSKDPEQIISRSYKETSSKDMVIVRDIEFSSMSERYLLPFYGKIHVGYIPKGRVLDSSKVGALVDCLSKRLQIQERLCAEISEIISNSKQLQAEGVMVVVEAEHLSMRMRGIKDIVTTYASYGKYADVELRNEFLQLIR